MAQKWTLHWLEIQSLEMLVRRRGGMVAWCLEATLPPASPPGRSLTSSSTSSTFVLGGGSVTSIGSWNRVVKYFLGTWKYFLCLTFSRWGGVGRLRVASSTQGVSLGSVLIIETVEVLGGGAVEVEPPVTDEVVLVEEGAVGTEEAVLGQTYNI